MTRFLPHRSYSAAHSARAAGMALVAAVVLMGAAMGPAIARADTANVQDQLSKTQQEVNNLFQLMDQSGIPDTQKLQLEIDIKKKIITDVISVSDAQIDNVRAQIAQAPIPQTADWQNVVDGFNALLDANEHYYQTISDAIATNPQMTNDDIRSIAAAMEKQKTNTIDPDIKHIQTVLTTFNIKDILGIADARTKKVGSDVDKIYTKGLTQNPWLKTQYTQAASLITDAHRANDMAQSITLNMYADQTDTGTQTFMENLAQQIAQWEASSTPATTTPTSTSATSTADASSTPSLSPISTSTLSVPPTVSTPSTTQMRSYIESLVVESLNDIQSAYAIFMNMSQNVNKYL